MILPLLLSLFIFLPDVAEGNCHDHRYGVPSKSCKRVKDPTFQIRGDIRIVPMWEFILMKEPSEKRVKRSTSFRNGTLRSVHSGGNHGLPVDSLPTSNKNLNQANSFIKTPVLHQLLIQPIDSSAPASPVQRHIIQSQGKPTIGQLPIHVNKSKINTNHKTKRQGVYSALAQPPPAAKWGNNRPSYQNPTPSYQQGYPQQFPAPQRQQQYQPQPQTTNYNQAPQRPLYIPPPPPKLQVYPPQQLAENPYQTRNGVNNYRSRNSYGTNNRKHGRNGKKGKSSKMCKMCRKLSEEDESEEKEMACDLCSKSRRKGKKKGKSLRDGMVGGRRKSSKSSEDSDDHDDSMEGEGGGTENFTNDDENGADDYEDDGESTTIKPNAVSQPTILDFVERSKQQNKLMRIPVYRGKKLEAESNGTSGAYEDGDDNGEHNREEEEESSQYSSNIRDMEQPTKYSSKPNVKYSYPPKDTLPLQTCFHNPSGYVCCNLELNNVVESTYKEVRELPNFNPCNLQLIANKVQRASERMFGHPFESIVSHADFAQNINFSGDLVCKLEIDGKYMIAYGTPYHADDAVGPQGPDGKPLPVRSLKL